MARVGFPSRELNPSLLSNEYLWLFPLGIKRLECEADHSHPFSAEIKNGGAVPPLSQKSP
jgi:hypothetical protein